jgi:GNAT superfamily N-acetyltransferase
MPHRRSRASELTIRPLTPNRWPDLEALFGDRGACGGCWCMWWRMGQSDWAREKGAGTKRMFRALVRKGPPPGLLAYAGREAVGWCAIAPREVYPRLARSRILARVDDRPVWSVSCFFVRRDWRRRGVTVALLREASHFVAESGGRIVEGYPSDVERMQPAAFVHHGLLSAFTSAGFEEVARRSARRPIVRRSAERTR